MVKTVTLLIPISLLCKVTLQSEVTMNCAELGTAIHNLGISDSKLADDSGITRAYACDVRNGHRQGSHELEKKWEDLLYQYRNEKLITVTSIKKSEVESTPEKPKDPTLDLLEAVLAYATWEYISNNKAFTRENVLERAYWFIRHLDITVENAGFLEHIGTSIKEAGKLMYDEIS